MVLSSFSAKQGAPHPSGSEGMLLEYLLSVVLYFHTVVSRQHFDLLLYISLHQISSRFLCHVERERAEVCCRKSSLTPELSSKNFYKFRTGAGATLKHLGTHACSELRELGLGVVYARCLGCGRMMCCTQPRLLISLTTRLEVPGLHFLARPSQRQLVCLPRPQFVYTVPYTIAKPTQITW